MPAQANANVVAMQLEKVCDKVPLLYEPDGAIDSTGEGQSLERWEQSSTNCDPAETAGSSGPCRQ
jgi:hypothetical protein